MRTSTKQKATEICRRDVIANLVFKDYGYDGNFPEFMARLRKHIGTVKAQCAMCERREGKWAATKSMYDLDSQESIEGTLGYIADRFNCTGRLHFLVALAETNY